MWKNAFLSFIATSILIVAVLTVVTLSIGVGVYALVIHSILTSI